MANLYIKSNDGSVTLSTIGLNFNLYYYDTQDNPRGIYSRAPFGATLQYDLTSYAGINTSPNQTEPNITSGYNFDSSPMAVDTDVYVVSSTPPPKHINKIIRNSEVVLDLTGDTVAADKLLSGYTAHDSEGKEIEGEYVPPAVYDGTVI